MTNFRLILAALRVAKKGANTRLKMGMSVGDNAYGDCVSAQVDDLCAALGVGEGAINLKDHLVIYNRLRGAFWRAVY